MYVCGVPNQFSTFEQIFRTDQTIFGKSVLPDVAREIFIKRPEVYSAVFGPDDSVAAYLDCYPLKAEWAKLFIDGDLCEADFTSSMVLNRDDDHDGCCFYAGSVVVDSKFDPLMRSVLLCSLIKWRASHLQSLSIRSGTAIMTTATTQGRRLARGIGARKLRSGAGRKDGLDIYGRRFKLASLKRLIASIDSFLTAQTVRLDLNFRPR